MKKLVLTSVCALSVAGVAFAQGTLNWNAVSPGGFTAVTNTASYSPLFGGGAAGGVSGATVAGGNNFYYELLYNTTFNPAAPAIIGQPSTVAQLTGGAWIDTGLEATNNTVVGHATPISPSLSAVPQGSWPGGVNTGGQTNNIMLVGWSSNLGTTWATAEANLNNWATFSQTLGGANAFFGMSTPGWICPNIAPATGPTLFGAAQSSNGQPINSLNTPLYLLPVPEPATFALAGLGGLAMLMFRRRK